MIGQWFLIISMFLPRIFGPLDVAYQDSGKGLWSSGSMSLFHRFCDFCFVGSTENLQDAFKDTSTEPGAFALAFYSGLFSYAGW